MKINIKYIVSFIVLFIIETIIALFVHDQFIRPYFGDMLVVILMYTFIRGFTKKTIKFLPIDLFIFAAIVETAQYFKIVDLLHLQNNKAATIIIGSSFDIKDILCYLVGSVILIAWEKIEKNRG
ncbi:MAG: DUF2809 domain-containing protein [Clostridiaceae bacterium]